MPKINILDMFVGSSNYELCAELMVYASRALPTGALSMDLYYMCEQIYMEFVEFLYRGENDFHHYTY